jgi:peptidoglycan/xylan/chitin deacetylase (PgdA/CDA1 family)
MAHDAAGPGRVRSVLLLLVILTTATSGCELLGLPALPATTTSSPSVSPGVSPSPSVNFAPSPSPRPTTIAHHPRPAITRGVISRVPTQDREIAITIDDGGDPAVCAAMAGMLLRSGVPATFFPIGREVARSPAVWARIAQHFPIGNHTAFHAILTKLDAGRIERQILTDERLVQRAIGRPPIHVLRPPGGAWDMRVQRVADAIGYHVLLLWDVSDADTALHSRPAGMLRAALRGGPGSVLLMHCNRPVSQQLLPRIIAGYRARGFRFVTIPQLLSGR